MILALGVNSPCLPPAAAGVIRATGAGRVICQTGGNKVSTSREILERLIAFASVSVDTNLPILGWIEDYLLGLGFTCHRLPDASGQKAGLFARIGPAGDGGVLLSAHCDVVPVTGQVWTHDPFRLTEQDGRFYGRGTTDMKGFLAAALAAAALAARADLTAPLMLAISYDEELGCLGIRAMIDRFLPLMGRPDYCIVGEPTEMQIAIGHKGKAAYRATCHGMAGHSAMAPRFINALHLAADLIGVLRAEQDRLLAEGAQDLAYDVPSATVHAGRLSGGVALNIVPDRAVLDFEIRHLPAEPAAGILARIQAGARAVVAAAANPEARIEIAEVNAYPGLETAPDAVVVAKVAALLDAPQKTKVAYGTEAGFFAALGIATVVCGPGSMNQGHQPDEFLEVAQLDRCDAMLWRLVQSLSR